MKKLVFVGVTLFGISVCAGELWGATTIRSSKRLSKSSPNLQSNSFQSGRNSSSVIRNSSNVRSVSKNQKTTAKNYVSKSYGNLRSVSNSASKKNTTRSVTKSTTANNIRVSQNGSGSFLKLKLESNVVYILKNIIKNIPSSDIRVLMSNMDILSRSLPRKSKDEDVKVVVEKMNKATVCFDELLHMKSNLYAELFNQKETRSNLSDSVDLDRIIESLNRVDTNKFGEIVAICVQKRLSTQIINNLEAFSKKIKETKKILGEIKKEFSPIMLSRIEGLPELKNLEAANTAANRRLANSKEESEANKITDAEDYFSEADKISGAEDYFDDNLEEDNHSLNNIHSQAEFEENIDEDVLYVPQKKPEQKKKPKQKPNRVSQQENYAADEQSFPQKPNRISQQENYAADEQSFPQKPNRISQQENYTANEQSFPQKPNWVSQQEDENDSNTQLSHGKIEQIKPQKYENSSGAQSSTVDSGGKNNTATTVSDLNGTETPEEFYRLLETNIGLLSERDFTNKQMTAFKKIKGYLNDTKSVRSFEQKISDVNRIVKAYNSLVALSPKTKSGKRLPSVRRSKIKSLLEKIYTEVFDDLSSRIKRLQSNTNLDELNMGEDFKKILAANEKNKENFEQSDSGREKRDLMIKSVEAYDKLMEKIWKYPKLIKTKRDQEEFDRIGYTLDPVILSIDINPSR